MTKYHVLLRMSNENIKLLDGRNDPDDPDRNPIVCKAHLVAISETDDMMCASRDRNPNIVQTVTSDNFLTGQDVIAAFYPEGCRLQHVPSNNLVCY